MQTCGFFKPGFLGLASGKPGYLCLALRLTALALGIWLEHIFRQYSMELQDTTTACANLSIKGALIAATSSIGLTGLVYIKHCKCVTASVTST